MEKKEVLKDLTRDINMPSFCDEEGYCEALDDCTAIDVGECSCCNINRIVRAFNRGIEYQKQKSNSPWISVEDDLPCNHKELLDLLHTKFVITINSKRTVELNYMIEGLNGWEWAFKKYYDILYWMRIPELPEVPDELQLPSTDFDNKEVPEELQLPSTDFDNKKAKFASELLEENEWIDVDEDLPYNHKELLLTEGRTIDVLTKDENEDISTDFMIKFNNKWYWNANCDSDYSHWMIIPTD